MTISTIIDKVASFVKRMSSVQKLILVTVSIVMLSGCAPSRIDALNTINGIEYGIGDFGEEVIERYTVQKGFFGSMGSIAVCVASTIDNSGGSTIQHASQSGIVANGVASYSSMGIKYYVKYILAVQQIDSGITYRFSHITQAQSNTGYAPNGGFSKITTDKWSASGVVHVIKSLDNEVTKVESCLGR